MAEWCSPRWRGLAMAVAGVLAAVSVSSNAKPALHSIDMRGVRFAPVRVDARSGDRVVWTNRDSVPHTVTAADASWDSGEIPPGESFEWTVKAGDDVRYRCRYHAGMTGEIGVP